MNASDPNSQSDDGFMLVHSKKRKRQNRGPSKNFKLNSAPISSAIKNMNPSAPHPDRPSYQQTPNEGINPKQPEKYTIANKWNFSSMSSRAWNEVVKGNNIPVNIPLKYHPPREINSIKCTKKASCCGSKG